MVSQEQFLEVVDRDEAQRRFQAAIRLAPLGDELVDLREALGRVLAADVVASVDVPSFDRSNLDGFAVRALDTYGAREERPCKLKLLAEVAATGVVPKSEVAADAAVSIATGGMLPRGADAIVAVEHAECVGGEVVVRKAVAPGFGVTFAGTDISHGETVLWRGEVLTSRETGVLSAIGCASVRVWRRPKVAILSTGDEIIAPGEPMRPGLVYDSNAQILTDAIRELGGEPISLGIVPDDFEKLRAALKLALARADVVLLSGGTSKGSGDVSYRVVAELKSPGIVAHGVALKPGKPICLAAHDGKPVVVLPGFPTSAIFTFHEFVAPVIRSLAGKRVEQASSVAARLAVKINSEIGRTEYVLVGLVTDPEAGHLVAYPMGKGSGSVTAFSRADGFLTVGRHQEIVEAGAQVNVQLSGRDVRAADLVVIGSHCVGLDYLLGLLQEKGFHTKFLSVGSTAGLSAATRNECDLAGMHLLDLKTGQYNYPYITSELLLVSGYRRLQGVVYRAGDPRFTGASATEAIERVKRDPRCMMVNRNQGSGTRILIDRLLEGTQPNGYAVQARNHTAVAAAVLQDRADWGVAIESVSRHKDLGFLPIGDEHYDFIVPQSRLHRPAVQAFRKLLADPQVREHLNSMGLRPSE
ncbi:MAG: molybdopterin biosynthesis protein [Planctomycetia bacterium]|nr:molybdopterin biosynthesis protein [Planctomycetia bacterium]